MLYCLCGKLGYEFHKNCFDLQLTAYSMSIMVLGHLPPRKIALPSIPNPKTNPKPNSNPNWGQFFLGAVVWLLPNPKTKPDLDPNPNPNQMGIFLGGQLSGYRQWWMLKNHWNTLKICLFGQTTKSLSYFWKVITLHCETKTKKIN